jgi:hypothetical protein
MGSISIEVMDQLIAGTGRQRVDLPIPHGLGAHLSK